MSLVSNILEAAYCNGTHHKLAFHALIYLKGTNSEKWKDFFLFHQDRYLEGSKAPDKAFKDFKNHVLHVDSGNWGGAATEAGVWYRKTVEHLQSGDWDMAAYSAGVLSHYVTDPIMPFHTAQSEAESNIHRAVEWSVSKSYDSLQKDISFSASVISIEGDGSEKWLENLIVTGAEFSNRSYKVLIDHYDFKKGSKNPPEGLDQTCREHIAKMLGYARILLACIIDRAIKEAGVEAPEVNLNLKSVIAALKIPVAWVTRKMTDAGEIKIVQNMYREFEETGRVELTLSEDVRVVRDLVRSESADNSKPIEQRAIHGSTNRPATALKSEESARSTANRFRERLPLTASLEAAPSIGAKTAARLSGAGLNTVKDLLEADPDSIAQKVDTRYITPQAIRDWQDQARLAHLVPQLRGHDVQILVGGGFRTVADLASASPDEILAIVIPFVESELGKRVVKSGNEPDLDEVTKWLEWAGSAA